MASPVLAPASSSRSVNPAIRSGNQIFIHNSPVSPGCFSIVSPMPTARKSKSSKPRDRVTLAYLGAMALVVILCILTIWKLNALNNTPTWWTQLDNNPNITNQHGIELENRITTALTRLRAPDKSNWTAAINQDQLNSWLTHRLKDSITSFSKPSTSSNPSLSQLDQVRIAINPKGLTVGTRITHAQGSTILWAIITPGTNDQGHFTIDIHKLVAGTTRIPTRLASTYLNPDQLGSASIDLGDGRIVRIKAIRPGNQRLEFALQTKLKDNN